MSVRNEKISFAILIGGKSTRFGSDKGIFEFKGKPLLSYQLEILNKFRKKIFIIAHSQEQVDLYKKKIKFYDYIEFFIDDLSLIEDKTIRTPMIGLYTLFNQLNKLKFDKVFTLSCDAPLIKHEVVNLMLSQEIGYDCYIPRWKNGFLEPLFAIYPVKKALKMAKESIESHSFKLINILSKKWNIKYVSIEDFIRPLDEKLLNFLNINGPVDLEKLMNLFTRQ